MNSQNKLNEFLEWSSIVITEQPREFLRPGATCSLRMLRIQQKKRTGVPIRKYPFPVISKHLRKQ